MLIFTRKNVNPKGVKTTDCVIRAITVASGKRYSEVWEGLLDIAAKTGYTPSDPKNYRQYLTNIGFVRHGKPFKLTGKTFRACEADQFLEGKHAILELANHLTAVDGTSYVDTWDCGRKSVYCYWVIAR